MSWKWFRFAFISNFTHRLSRNELNFCQGFYINDLKKILEQWEIYGAALDEYFSARELLKSTSNSAVLTMLTHATISAARSNSNRNQPRRSVILHPFRSFSLLCESSSFPAATKQNQANHCSTGLPVPTILLWALWRNLTQRNRSMTSLSKPSIPSAFCPLTWFARPIRGIQECRWVALPWRKLTPI